jgi:hypothetical protein
LGLCHFEEKKTQNPSVMNFIGGKFFLPFFDTNSITIKESSSEKEARSFGRPDRRDQKG